MHEKKNTILVVDNEPQIHKMLGIILDGEKFKVIESTSGKQAIRMCISIKPDLILIDPVLPDIDGKEVITTIREWSETPIIILSACTSDEEIITSLNMGANDYVVKPFNLEVLLARINAFLRVSAVRETGTSELKNGPLRMDLVRHEVFLDDQLISFTPKEYDLLRYFMVNCGKMLAHREILKNVWGESHSEDTSYLRVFIGQIREKIEGAPQLYTFIITEAGIGYRMESCKPNTNFPSANDPSHIA